MPKLVNLGNGQLLIGIDNKALVKDLYYPYAGLENHVSEHLTHHIGVFAEGKFSWMGDNDWEIEILTAEQTMASAITAVNNRLGVKMVFEDVVYNEKNIFIRDIDVENLHERKREIRVFFNQQFNISHSHTGDTAYYDPRDNVIIHYKGRRVFLVNLRCGINSFDQYSIGLMGIEGKAGTYKDAEDGELHENPVEHGQVDSVLGITLEMEAKQTKNIDYWIVAHETIPKAKKLNEHILVRGANDVIKTTKDYWKAWVNNQNFSFYGLETETIELFNDSLINIRTHVSSNGAIIASGDSNLLQFGRDTYGYVWPRDAAYSALALERAGDFNASRRFFDFCDNIITNEGYFMHKYRPDRALGSSWHPWVRDGKKQLPIQEDETAIVVFALWNHYILSKDLEFIEGIYNSLIKRAAGFMINYRDDKTSLPDASYDLWEQEYGIHTYTASTVYGALIAAANFAELLGKSKSSKVYKDAAEDIKNAILKYLFNEEENLFYKSIDTSGNKPLINKTVDMSSVYGVYKFGVLEPTDKRLKNAMENTIERLTVNTDIGGIARYEGDVYHRIEGDYPGNPWVITTMWLAQYHIALAKNEADMDPVKEHLDWAVKLASKSGVLPEQFNPFTGEHLSAAPLIWSHAEYVTTVIEYLEKLEELGVCKACYPIDQE